MEKYLLIGKSLPHSWSPQIHKNFGIDYGINEIENERQLEAFLNQKKFCGLNVTIPYKSSVIPFLDEVDTDAQDIGAVNTIINSNGKLLGFNTDIGGMIFALSNAKIKTKNKNVLILGSGGTSKTASFALKRLGAKSINIVSRNGDVNYDNVYEFKDVNLIINTTPIGMFNHEQKSLVDLSKFEKLESVFDVVYNPIKTKFLYEAEKLNLNFANGLGMLVEQARLARNLFAKYGTEKLDFIDANMTEMVCHKLENQMRNIVLIGMSGCGKTSVGKVLAQKLNREFVDTDDKIIKKLNKDIPTIFNQDGENYFRKIEQEIIREYAVKSGQIIASGGGAILNEDNRFFLKSNSIVIYLKRNINELDMKNRPLSTSRDSVALLFESRKDIYEKMADIEIENVDFDNTISEILERIK